MEATTGPAQTLEVQLFGSLEIQQAGKALPLPTIGKTTSLLAYLILHQINPQSREKLATIYWGDTSDERARHSLRTALATLRKIIGEELFISNNETVQLNPNLSIWVDAIEIQKIAKNKEQIGLPDLLQAIGLYKGDLLENFYDDWIIREREQFQELYLELLLHVTQIMRSRSEYKQAIEYAKKALLKDPVNERTHQQLIFCHLASGDREAAIKQYEACRYNLREELGVEPSSETIALYQWIAQSPVKALEARITNLPIPITSFIGRGREMARVKELLSEARLVTLVGAGGCGKTRLAIQVASDLVDSFKDGVWWVDFAPLTDTSLIYQTIAKAVGVNENPNLPMSEQLINALHSRVLLLVLDNCEHMVAEVAHCCFSLLSACSKLKILTTSREVLGTLGETILRVPSLSFPMARSLSADEKWEDYESICLFKERVISVNPEFKLTVENAAAIVKICQRLDGIPLAIELAAASARYLPAQQIVDRLNDRFSLLTHGNRTALPRHQTLKAMIDWSYNLLTEKEQAILCPMSVCAGGWTLETTEAIGSDVASRQEVFDILSHLADKSLIEFMDAPGYEGRYRMLETVRQFGLERLIESGKIDAVRHSHALYFAKLAEDAERQFRGPEMHVWMARLEIEHDNFRVALEWSFSHESPETCLRYAGALGIFWHRGYLREGRDSLERMLSISKDASPLLRVKAMTQLSWLARDLGDYKQATLLCEESLEILREAENKTGLVPVLIQNGLLAVYKNYPGRAFAAFHECLTISEELNFHWGRAISLVNLAHAALFNLQWDMTARFRGEESLKIFTELGDETEQAHALIILGSGAHYENDDERGRKLVEQAVVICRQARDNRQLAWTTTVLGIIIRWLGNIDEALPIAKEGLRLAIDLGEKTICTFAVILLAGLACERGKIEDSLHLLGWAIAWGKSFGYQASNLQMDIVNREIEMMRTMLGEKAFTKSWEDGENLLFEQTIEIAMQV